MVPLMEEQELISRKCGLNEVLFKSEGGILFKIEGGVQKKYRK